MGQGVDKKCQLILVRIKRGGKVWRWWLSGINHRVVRRCQHFLYNTNHTCEPPYDQDEEWTKTQTDTDRHRQTQTHTVKDKSEPFLHIFTTLTTLFKLRMIRVNKIHRVEKIKRSRQRVIWMGHKMIFVRTS